MTQHNFPDRGDKYSLERRSLTHADIEIEPNSTSDPVVRKFAIGMFITAVAASSGFIIYLFDLPGSIPKVTPHTSPSPNASSKPRPPQPPNLLADR
jgi:hypothetical protein